MASRNDAAINNLENGGNNSNRVYFNRDGASKRRLEKGEIEPETSKSFKRLYNDNR